MRVAVSSEQVLDYRSESKAFFYTVIGLLARHYYSPSSSGIDSTGSIS